MTRIEQRSRSARGDVILCADDYAMTAGVSAGIEELAGLQRLSATSALVTGGHWGEHGPHLARLRERLIIGLHFNLTLGSPLSRRSPGIAPGGTFSKLGTLLRKALMGRLPSTEIADELHRQLDAFEAATGASPDMIDGHQHVHAVPGIRDTLLTALARRFPGAKPLLRDPSDLMLAMIGRRGAPAKAVGLSFLTAGFGQQARRLGFETNIGFSGVSDFDDRVPYAREIERNLISTSRIEPSVVSASTPASTKPP